MASESSSTPLVRKLGIRSGHVVRCENAPEGFLVGLPGLPPDVQVAEPEDSCDTILLFVMSNAELNRWFPILRARLAMSGGLWVIWPKKASKVKTDVNFDSVQRVGLESGLVDNKICSVDATWTGLRFVVRLADRK